MRRADGLDWSVGAALVLLAGAALFLAVRLGAGAGAGGDDILAEIRARAEKRILTEREQIRPLLEAASRGEHEVARRGAEAALERLPGNSQLHLLLAGELRAGGSVGPALREYRRAVELFRDYADRRSPRYIGCELDPWLKQVAPGLEVVSAAEALGDLHVLERFLAGGCS